MADYNELKRKAQEIRDEVKDGANTANRIGGTMLDIVNALEEGGGELTKITYAELKALRDNGELLEGHLYRITDYVTTTAQSSTKSAGNVFDVIVLATSASELSHIARAIQHEGDTYFDGNDLGAWKLWYDLDNDTEKYEWADATNGKGVIYRMIDEKRNDCPYDFKNILFYTTSFTDNTTSDKYYYTFSYVVSGKLYDGTVEKHVLYCYGNSMGVYIYTKKKRLNNNMFRNVSFNNYCHSNTFGNHCYSNTFGNNCYSNTFGNNCQSNTFGNNCYSNTFGNYCQFNTFGNNCQFNTFGNHCYSNTFGNNCYSNTFGNNCYSNTFGNYCQFNTFGNNCQSNTFGDNFYSRHFDSNKATITLNDEYYDDGSGQLVPIKHPDLSTQPSILPYKFMGQYVYEQLIPKSVLNIQDGAVVTFIEGKEPLLVKEPIFLEAWFVGINGDLRQANLEIEKNEDGRAWYYFTTPMKSTEWLRIVYTSMPKEGGYYGYNNY